MAEIDAEIIGGLAGKTIIKYDLNGVEINIDNGNLDSAVSKIEILDRVSKDGVAYRVCNITTIEGYDEALFLPRALNKLIDILRKK